MSSRSHLRNSGKSPYVDIHQIDDPAEFLNIIEMFKRTYYVYAPKRVDEKRIQAIINKHGLKHVRYAIGVLSDQHIGEADAKQPYGHFDLVVSRMKQKYEQKVASQRGRFR